MGNGIRNRVLLSVLLLSVFIVYVLTVFPAYKSDDSPETAASSWVLGIGHPPSYPLFTLASKLFSSFVPFGNPAFRMNLFSVLLSLTVLLMSYFLSAKVYEAVFRKKIPVLVRFSALLILAFSSLFWGQAIEAKGGIYMLNLVFFSALLYLMVLVTEKFSIRYIYAMSYLTGLAMANHWPSIVIIIPAAFLCCFKYKERISLLRAVFIILFLAAGLSAYLYLPLRGGADGVFVFMAKPDTWDKFWWTVLRSGYNTRPIALTAGLFRSQAAEFAVSFAENYKAAGLLVLPGLYALWKAKGIYKFLFPGIFLLIAVPVVTVNRTTPDILWVIGVFSLPAFYTAFIFILLGTGLIYESRYRAVLMAVVIVMAGYGVYSGFRTNDNSRNFYAYDICANVQKSLEPQSLYISDKDYFNMHLPYAETVDKSMRGTQSFSLFSLQYDWGIEAFTKKAWNIGLTPSPGGKNPLKIINTFRALKPVYLSERADPINDHILPYRQKTRGMLIKIASPEEQIPYGIYRNFSYRGIYETKDGYDTALTQLYGLRMADAAYDLFESGQYEKAARMYEYGVKFPGALGNGFVHYNMSVNYGKLGDTEKQLKSLERAVLYNKDLWQAYEDAGRIYVKRDEYTKAAEMFAKAVESGSPNQEILYKSLLGSK